MISSSVHSVIHPNRMVRHHAGIKSATALVAIGGCLVLGIAGCSSAASSASGHKTDDMSTESSTTSKALLLAAAESSRVNSLTADISVHSSSTGAGNLTGTVTLQ